MTQMDVERDNAKQRSFVPDRMSTSTPASVKGFTPLCLTWAAFDGDGLVIVLSLRIPPEI